MKYMIFFFTAIGPLFNILGAVYYEGKIVEITETPDFVVSYFVVGFDAEHAEEEDLYLVVLPKSNEYKTTPPAALSLTFDALFGAEESMQIRYQVPRHDCQRAACNKSYLLKVVLPRNQDGSTIDLLRISSIKVSNDDVIGMPVTYCSRTSIVTRGKKCPSQAYYRKFWH